MSEASAGPEPARERRNGEQPGSPSHDQSAEDGAEREPGVHDQPAVPGEPAVGANSAVLRIKTGPLAGPILTRVVAMMLTRAACPIDRLDDAMVVCDALAAHVGDHAEDGMVEFRVFTQAGSLQLRVGALATGGAQRLAAATTVPGVGDVLTPIADEVRVETPRSGGAEELVLDLAFADRV